MVYYKDFGMLSAKDMAAVKIATEICNNLELKRYILCASLDFNPYVYDCYRQYALCHLYHLNQQWNEEIKTKAKIMLRNLGLPKILQEKVLSVVLPIGARMLTWAEYHEVTFGFSREYSIKTLNSSFFTLQGHIDNKKAAAWLMNDTNLSIEQKFKLACIYCFTDRIPTLYKQMRTQTKLFKSMPQSFKHYELVRFWANYLMGGVGKLKGDKTLDQYKLEKAVDSGSKAAVEHFLEGTHFKNMDIVFDAAINAVRQRTNIKDDRIFRNRRYDGNWDMRCWVPNDYYMDILCFLLSKMTHEDQIELLKKDIEDVKYKEEFYCRDHRHSRILEYFLSWPYQDYFMKTVELMWDFLPEQNYAILLLKICDKIEPEVDNNLNYFEEKSYDYRGLLKKFWCQCPERYKRYVFTNQEVLYRTDKIVRFAANYGLLMKLLTLKNFTHEDKEIIRLILASVTDKENENMIIYEWKDFCIEFMTKEKWVILDRFVVNCFSSKEKSNEFRRVFIFKKEVIRIFIAFVTRCKWDAAESFIKWSALPENEITQFKREVICSWDGKYEFINLVSHYKDLEVTSKILKWCFTSEEQVKKFKKDLIFSDIGITRCTTLVTKDNIDLVDAIISWCLSSQDEIKEFKKYFAQTMGDSICEILISHVSNELSNGEFKKIFKGGRWEEVEKFITWCFTSESEISNFKKNVLSEGSSARIHLNLIECNQWEEAETFFAWLNLSSEEVKELKKESLFGYCDPMYMFFRLLYSKEDDEEFSDYGSKQEAIDLLLRWYLTDKETVLEFVIDFKRMYQNSINEKVLEDFDLAQAQRLRNEGALRVFDLAIEQRLSDLDQEKKVVKRKSETFTPNKRVCTLNLEN